jgi:hypothetical protein
LSLRSGEYVLPDVGKSSSSLLVKSSYSTSSLLSTGSSAESNSSSGVGVGDGTENYLTSYKIYSDVVHLLSSRPLNESRVYNNPVLEDERMRERYAQVKKHSSMSHGMRSMPNMDSIKMRKRFSISLDDLDEDSETSPHHHPGGGGGGLITPNTPPTNSTKFSLDEFESEQLNSDDTGDDLYGNEDESQSNSKFESYLGELIELVIKDFIMPWLGNVIWENEKFSVLIK